MVTKFVPYPANSGGKLRSLAILRRLSALGDVVLCCFEDETSDAEELRRWGIDVRTVPWRPDLKHVAQGLARTRSGSAARFWDSSLATLVRTATAEAKTDILQVEYSQLAPYLREGYADIKILDFHNIESSLALSFARSSREAKARLAYVESVILKALERRACGWADVVVVVSEEDRERLPGTPPEVLVCPNGWDPTEPLPPAENAVAAFVALMGWKPNSDAALWLVREVWPLVVKSVPGARLLLVGREPTEQVMALGSSDVEVTGTVPSIKPYLERTRVALAPLLSGGGTRLKVLEALDAGRPVVSTRIGIEGLTDLIGSGVLVADDPIEFARHVSELLLDADSAVNLGLEGHFAARNKYSWEGTLRPWAQRISGNTVAT